VLGNFEYRKARSIEEGCQALADAKGTAAILAGGTDLLVEIRNGLKSPKLLIDCKRVEELQNVTLSPTATSIGANVPMNRLIEDRKFRESYPALADALFSIGTYQLRSRATIAGNLCNASPAADSAPVLLVRQAAIEVTGTEGSRTIPMQEFFAGVKRTTLRSDEIVTAIRIPANSALHTAFLKQQRIKGHDLAVVNIAGAYDSDERTLQIAVGSCAPTPVLLDPIHVDASNLQAFSAHVARSVVGSVSPISDVRASATYRNAILPTLAKRIVFQLLGDKEASSNA